MVQDRLDKHIEHLEESVKKIEIVLKVFENENEETVAKENQKLKKARMRPSGPPVDS